MALIHRYVLGCVSVAALGAVLVFAFVLLVGEVMRDMLSLLTDGLLTFTAFAKLIALVFPYVFIYSLPVGLVAGILLAFGRMSSDQEIVALRAAGVSVWRLSRSVIVFGGICSVVALAINLDFGPRARSSYRVALADTIRTSPVGFIQEKAFVRDFPGYVMYVGSKVGERLEDVWLWKLDDRERVFGRIRAEFGLIHYNEESGMLGLDLHRGSYESMSPDDPENYLTGYGNLVFEEFPIEFRLDGLLSKTTPYRKLYWLPLQEFLSEWRLREAQLASGDRSSEALARVIEARMAFHEKLANGISAFSLSLMAIPLGVVTGRKETSANLFLAMGLTLVYYLSMTAVGWLARFPAVHPHLLYWLPNGVLMVMGTWLLTRVDHFRVSGLFAGFRLDKSVSGEPYNNEKSILPLKGR